jgi:hypothetical protein
MGPTLLKFYVGSVDLDVLRLEIGVAFRPCCALLMIKTRGECCGRKNVQCLQQGWPVADVE